MNEVVLEMHFPTPLYNIYEYYRSSKFFMFINHLPLNIIPKPFVVRLIPVLGIEAGKYVTRGRIYDTFDFRTHMSKLARAIFGSDDEL